MFERKEAPKEKPANSIWPILKWYWILIPVLYFTFVLPNAVEEAGTEAIGMGVITTIIYQFTNLSMGGLMTMLHPLEQSRSGAANNFLKIAAIQQLLVQSYFGFILILIVWYKLPNKVSPDMISEEENEQKSLPPKTIYMLTGIVTAVSIFVLILRLTAN